MDALNAGNPDHIDPALFEISARIKQPADLDYVRDQILDAIRSFQQKPVDAARLDAVKRHLRYRFLMGLDSSDSIAETLAHYVAMRRTPETVNRLYDLYAQITPEDVQQIVQKYMVENGRTIVTLTSQPGGAK